MTNSVASKIRNLRQQASQRVACTTGLSVQWCVETCIKDLLWERIDWAVHLELLVEAQQFTR